MSGREAAAAWFLDWAGCDPSDEPVLAARAFMSVNARTDMREKAAEYLLDLVLTAHTAGRRAGLEEAAGEAEGRAKDHRSSRRTADEYAYHEGGEAALTFLAAELRARATTPPATPPGWSKEGA